MGIHDLGAFLAASFLLWITPGPDTFYILARSIAQGRVAGVVSALGIGSGVLVHTIAAALGLSVLVATSAWAFMAVKLFGAAFLLWLGLRALRGSATNEAPRELPATGLWAIYRQGVVTNVLNPKIAIFFLAFLPQFVDTPAGFHPLPFLTLGGLFVAGGTLWCIATAYLCAASTGAMRRSPRLVSWLERAAGCVYIGLGLNLLRSRGIPG